MFSVDQFIVEYVPGRFVAAVFQHHVAELDFDEMDYNWVLSSVPNFKINVREIFHPWSLAQRTPVQAPIRQVSIHNSDDS